MRMGPVKVAPSVSTRYVHTLVTIQRLILLSV